MKLVTLDEIRAARTRIQSVAKITPLVDVSSVAGRPLWLKCESLQPGGAFKIRGAYNMVAQLTKDELRRGVITYSSGNHGQAVAIAARAMGAPAVVVMPTTAPKIKSDNAAGFGTRLRRGTATRSASVPLYTSLSSERFGSSVSSPPPRTGSSITACTTTSLPASSMPDASVPRIIGSCSSRSPTPFSDHTS